MRGLQGSATPEQETAPRSPSGQAEVWVRTCLLPIDIARSANLPVNRAFEGLSYDEAGLRSRLRVPWDDFCTLAENVEALCGGPERADEIVRRYYDAAIPEMRALAGAISPKQLVRLVAEVVDPILFPPMAFRFHDLGERRVRVVARLRGDLRPCATAFRTTTPSFRALPRVLGLGDATVEATVTGREGRWDLLLPRSSTSGTRSRRAAVAYLEVVLGEVGAGQRVALTVDADAPTPDRIGRLARRWSLTPRQAEVLGEIASGASNREIAQALRCSEKTVETHITQILAKSGSSSRAHLITQVWT